MAQDFNRLPEIIRELETDVEKAVREAVETILVPAARARLEASGWELEQLSRALHTEAALEGTYVVAGGKVDGHDVWWGHLVEHGAVGPRETRDRPGRKGHRSGTMPARPFLVPALEESREAIVEAAAEAVRKATG
jgi:hypothetical protein